MPLRRQGGSRGHAFFINQASAFVEPNSLEHPPNNEILAALGAACSIERVVDHAYPLYLVMNQQRSAVSWGEHPIGKSQPAA